MSFNSWDFALFFPIVDLIYFAIPARSRTVWLLVASYFFYMSWNPRYALLIALSTLITWVCALPFDGAPSPRVRKFLLISSLTSNLFILAVFKYANFFFESAEAVMRAAGLTVREVRLDVLLPVGISFYTFQALSYTIDVYRGDIKPEKNLVRYALFVSFFPQLVAGPIERSGRLLPQIDGLAERTRRELWDYARVRDGLLLMLWGLFQKLVIADRISLFVKRVYGNYAQMGAVEIILAACLFSVQIYCDFGGYTNIARGAARVMGFELMSNFRQPYLARGIRDFWRRWHISLTTWFTDYLYIPLGGNRRGAARKYLNILIVFTLSGLWHGAEWSFVVWGLIHAIMQIAEDIGRKKITLRRSGKTNSERGGYTNASESAEHARGEYTGAPVSCRPAEPRPAGVSAFARSARVKGSAARSGRANRASVYSTRASSTFLRVRKFFSILVTDLLVTIAWVFFAADSCGEALGIIGQCFKAFHMVRLDELGISSSGWIALGLGMTALFAVDVLKERGVSVAVLYRRLAAPVRALAASAALWAVIMLGAYGGSTDSSFIYFRF